MPTGGLRPRAAEVQRRQTYERVFAAAIAEFKRAGMADADIGAIVTAAGVARGTFYFHFPSKEHVLLELERREEKRIAAEMTRFTRTSEVLPDMLAEVVRVVVAAERRLGPRLFKDVLAVHFSPSRPPDDEWSDHEIIVVLVDRIEAARDRGEVDPSVEASLSAMFFLLGLYALLTTTQRSSRVRAFMLDAFVAQFWRGIEAR
ncbi:TetR family transcriptional regulator [Mycolicibacterium sediminis]|uniref:TetR family transcriptional regulator n=1 Tax=Mycolicibacterium sediminis TaxID=1286180 RepID=A0A7I7QWI8_9MYCO|nr:TetR family transcriptional regulator [Mycolicibacterium sediminis]